MYYMVEQRSSLLHNVLLSGTQNATDLAACHARRSVILNHPTLELNLLMAEVDRLGATTVTPAISLLSETAFRIV
jgi:hypothetical protein